MQALSAWLCFVQLLARHAPEVLERIAAQAAVVLLPVLEPADTQGNPAAAAGAAGVAAAGGGADAGDQGGQEELDQAAVQLAAQVLHSIVVQHRELVRAALQNMPPLPSLAVLKDVNAVLIQVGWYCCIKCVLAGGAWEGTCSMFLHVPVTNPSEQLSQKNRGSIIRSHSVFHARSPAQNAHSELPTPWVQCNAS